MIEKIGSFDQCVFAYKRGRWRAQRDNCVRLREVRDTHLAWAYGVQSHPPVLQNSLQVLFRDYVLISYHIDETVKITLDDAHYTVAAATVRRLNALCSLDGVVFAFNAKTRQMTVECRGQTWAFTRELTFSTGTDTGVWQRTLSASSVVCDRDDPSFVSPVPVVQRHRVPWGKMGVKLVTSVLPLPWDWECVDPAYFWPLRLGREARRGVVKGLIDDLMLNPPAVDAMVMACRMSFVGHLLDTSALCDTLSTWQSGEPLSFTRHEAHYIAGRAGKVLSAYARERG